MIGCLLVLVFLIFRMWHTNRTTYIFLAWNLFLAWVPLGVAIMSTRLKLQSWKLAGVSMVWLLFFPNAPYLITDLYHLSHFTGIPLWYDALMLFIAAYTSLAMGFISLRMMETQWKSIWKQKFLRLRSTRSRWYTRIVLMILLFIVTGFGLYLGRVLRYNSWDVITDTGGLTLDIARQVLNPFENYRTWGFTLVYATGLFFFYQAWLGMPHFKKNENS
jgi:uncharacterized membrane protein